MRYLEDFHPGDVIELGRRAVSGESIVAFAREFDPQPFHLDEEAAKGSIYGGLLASGWHTAAILMRLLCDGFVRHVISMGSPGVDELRWLHPVRPGDVLSARAIVLEVVPSRSKPDRGVLHTLSEVRNQDGRVVMTLKGMSIIGRRPAAGADAAS